MRKLNTYLVVVLGIGLFQFHAIGQSTMDGFFPKKGEGSIAIGYTSKSYDKFYRGTTLTEGNPADFGGIFSKIVSIYGTYSFSDNITAIVNLPYISVQNENGIPDPVQATTRVAALQDLSLGIKRKLLSRKFHSSSITAGVGAVVRFPISDYEEAGILSVGNGAFSFEGIGMLQYHIRGGLFAELQGGYSVQQNNSFSVPNAFIGEFKVGYAHSLFYLSTSIGVQNSESSFDIGSEAFMTRGGPAILPETEVDYTVLSVNGYVPVGRTGLGVTVGYGKVLNGRNAGAESYITWGLVFSGSSFNRSTAPPRYILGH